MKSLIAAIGPLGMVGCAEKSETKTETKTTNPGGSTTVSTEKEVKKTGEDKEASKTGENPK